MTTIQRAFSGFYEHFSHDSVASLSTIYADNVEFIDPIHHIHGIQNLSDYFQNLMTNTQHCRFSIQQFEQTEQQGFVTWEMQFSHPKLNTGKLIQLAGISHIHIESDKICFQRDYYDLGAMLYENIPLLGRFVRFFKHRL